MAASGPFLPASCPVVGLPAMVSGGNTDPVTLLLLMIFKAGRGPLIRLSVNLLAVPGVIAPVHIRKVDLPASVVIVRARVPVLPALQPGTAGCARQPDGSPPAYGSGSDSGVVKRSPSVTVRVDRLRPARCAQARR